MKINRQGYINQRKIRVACQSVIWCLWFIWCVKLSMVHWMCQLFNCSFNVVREGSRTTWYNSQTVFHTEVGRLLTHQFYIEVCVCYLYQHKSIG